MSARVKGIVVTFKHDVSKEHAERVMGAIKLFDSVVSVEEVEEDVHDHVNREVIKYELMAVLAETIRGWREKK